MMKKIRTSMYQIFAFLSVTLLICTLFYTSVYAESTSPDSCVISLYNDRNGLPTGEANAVVQTPDGYIWIGSYAGLIRYDGTTFRNFSEEGLLPSSTVRSLFVDADGTLWVGSNDMGVFFMQGDDFVQPEGQPADSFLCIRGFTEDTNGTIYAASSTGIACIQDHILTLMGDTDLAQTTFYSAAVDTYGRIWGAVSGGAYVFDSNGALLSFVDSDLIFADAAEIYCVCTGSDGSVWCGSDQNLAAKLTFSGEALTADDIQITTYDTETVTTINSITALSDGGAMLNALHGFGILAPDGTFTAFSEEYQQASSVVNSCMDYEGNIWLASSASGIVKYSVGSYSYPQAAIGLSDVRINAITNVGGCFYFGTDNGLLIYDTSFTQIENELSDLLASTRIRNIISDNAGCIWIAAYSQTPVIRYDTQSGEITTWSQDDGLCDDSARVLLQLSDGSIAVGTQSGLNFIDTTGAVSCCDTLQGKTILCLTEAEDKTLLVGTDGNGLFACTGTAAKPFGTGKPDSGVILRVIPDTEPDCYFISTGSGLAYYDGTSYRMLSALHKQAGNIFDLYLREQKVYLLQNSGITVLDRTDVLADNGAEGTSYSFAHGLSGSLFANTWNWLSEDGDLYIATSNGVSIYDFEEPTEILPKIIVNQVSVDDTVYETPTVIDIDSNTRRISVNFAALSFTDTTQLSFAYQLVGFDKEETIVSDLKSDTVSYTNLPGGSYTFRVRVFLTNDPEQSVEYSVKINQAKSLTEQTWFRVLAIIASLIITVGITLLCLRARVKRIKRRQEQYQDMLDQTLKTFASTIDAKDKYTNGHSLRVAKYSAELARRMGLSQEDQEHIYYVALLHDIGKIGIPDSILTKPGKLTDEEREIIQQHPAIGGKILKDFTAIKDIAFGAKYHHERFDGTGYNEGLKGDEIPLIARIIAVADAYDAMSSKRCYRDSMPADVIIAELKRVSGTQLDPEIVPFMLAMIQEGAAPIVLPEESSET